MAGTGIHVEGLREKIKALEAAGVEVEELKEVMGAIAAEASDTLARTLPADSGKLRSTVRGNRAKGTAVVTIGRASVPYAGPIIYGWPKRNIKSRYPETIQHTDQIIETKLVEMLEDGFREICERHGLA